MNAKEKIKDIINLIDEKHIDMYFNISKEELDKYIDEIIEKQEINDVYSLYYYTNMIIKKIFGIYDSHTKLLFEKGDFYLPIKFKYINNKLYIIRTTEEYRNLLYGEVVKINNVDINKIVEEIENISAHSTNECLIPQVEMFLINGYKIKSLPSIDSSCNEFEFTIARNNNIYFTKLTRNEGYLLPINKPKSNYSYEIIDDKIVIIYNKCREDYEGQMIAFVKEIEHISKEYNINNFVVDIRGNLGGNSEIIKPLVEFLKNKEVITLVDECVFSSGVFAVVDLKNINSKFVGTGIATQFNHFGDINSEKIDDFIITTSHKYFYIDEISKKYKYADTKENFEILKQNKKLFIPQLFEPDYYSKKSIEDYKNGIDRELELAIDLMNKNKIKI